MIVSTVHIVRDAPATDAEARARGIWKIIAASSAGTMIEWYDFYIFGTLAATISSVFYPATDSEVTRLLKTLATFGVGFAVRPLGALVFGRIGDVVGRKYAFMITLLLMGGSTAVIGLLPSYATIGVAAPVILVLLRMLQGLALGGEYGGAAVYVAEHAPEHRRGYYTSFIQTTASLGLLVSLVVILAVRTTLGEVAFRAWGWRIPFLLSVVLVGFSYYIRRRMAESPLFVQLKSVGKTSAAPIRESYGSRARWKIFFLILFGITGGQAVVWYTGQFFALTFLQSILKIPLATSYLIVAAALVIGTPFFVFFGSLSDRVGRKRIMLSGMFIAALAYYPIYMGMKAASDPLSPVLLTLLVAVQVLFVTMVYGPVAAFLVESFPARIRYTSLSLPYHFGNGWFGGFLPLISTALVAKTGNIYAGLWYPISVALISVVIGGLWVPENRDARIWDEITA